MNPILKVNAGARGSIAVYLALVMTLIITSSAVILSGILSQQLRASQNFVASERSFYAANSGVEEALYLLVQQSQQGGGDQVITIDDGEVRYDDQTATYQVKARLVTSQDLIRVVPCVISLGRYAQEERRLKLQPGGDCALED